ncbi:hypothetical protein QPI69_003438 [Escherichia coli]|nr:hypothetical protein [Escherichia coli]
MTPQQENALRSIARQANSEIKKARQHFPDVTNGAIVIHTQRLKSDPGGNLLS